MLKYIIIIIFCAFSYSVSAQGFGAGVDEVIIMEQGNQEEEKEEASSGIEGNNDTTSEVSVEEETPVANIQESETDMDPPAKAESSDGIRFVVPVIIASSVVAIAVIIFFSMRKKKS